MIFLLPLLITFPFSTSTLVPSFIIVPKVTTNGVYKVSFLPLTLTICLSVFLYFIDKNSKIYELLSIKGEKYLYKMVIKYTKLSTTILLIDIINILLTIKLNEFHL